MMRTTDCTAIALSLVGLTAGLAAQNGPSTTAPFEVQMLDGSGENSPTNWLAPSLSNHEFNSPDWSHVSLHFNPPSDPNEHQFAFVHVSLEQLQPLNATIEALMLSNDNLRSDDWTGADLAAATPSSLFTVAPDQDDNALAVPPQRIVRFFEYIDSTGLAWDQFAVQQGIFQAGYTAPIQPLAPTGSSPALEDQDERRAFSSANPAHAPGTTQHAFDLSNLIISGVSQGLRTLLPGQSLSGLATHASHVELEIAVKIAIQPIVWNSSDGKVKIPQSIIIRRRSLKELALINANQGGGGPNPLPPVGFYHSAFGAWIHTALRGGTMQVEFTAPTGQALRAVWIIPGQAAVISDPVNQESSTHFDVPDGLPMTAFQAFFIDQFDNLVAPARPLAGTQSVAVHVMQLP